MAEASAGLLLRLNQDKPIPLDAALRCVAGELLALVGPSGSGKTTILRTIAGLYSPSSGHITCNGVTWLDTAQGINLAPQARRVGLVFQDYALFPHLTARENVAVPLGHLPREERSGRVMSLLELVHLDGLENHYPAELSGGQRQRVALARALARDPAILLLDEPFSAVDQVTRRKLQWELALLRRRVSIPILLVTHDLQEATTLADRISVLHRGSTLQDGPPAEVLNRPASPLVAHLMDQPNIFTATVVEQRAHHTRIRWGHQAIEARRNGAFSPGAVVNWMIPASHIVLHRRDRPSLGERENPVRGTIKELLVLGENSAITMAIDGNADSTLNFNISTHAARRNGLAHGAAITVSLLSEGIHLMPGEEG
jgi:molybdate transport system ATP-binding protein